MVVYHGTISIYRESLLNGINLSKGDDNSDFGKGFYTTTNYKQALSFAKYQKSKYNKAQIRLSNKFKNHCPYFVNSMLVKYNIDEEILKTFNGLIFESPDRKWAEFIYNNRLGLDYAISDYYNLDRKYDYVYGGLADSEIAPIVQEAKSGNLKFEEFFRLIVPYYKEDNQLSFHTEKVLNCLHLSETKIMRRDHHEVVNK